MMTYLKKPIYIIVDKIIKDSIQDILKSFSLIIYTITQIYNIIMILSLIVYYINIYNYLM